MANGKFSDLEFSSEKDAVLYFVEAASEDPCIALAFANATQFLDADLDVQNWIAYAVLAATFAAYNGGDLVSAKISAIGDFLRVEIACAEHGFSVHLYRFADGKLAVSKTV